MIGRVGLRRPGAEIGERRAVAAVDLGAEVGDRDELQRLQRRVDLDRRDAELQRRNLAVARIAARDCLDHVGGEPGLVGDGVDVVGKPRR